MKTETSFENGTLTLTRIYDMPRETVFAAWTEASQTKEWWGCGDTTHVSSDIEPKVGGKYIHKMTIKNVGVHPINGMLTAFDPPAHLAYQMPGMAEGEQMQVDVTFTETAGATKVQLTQSVIPAGYDTIIENGWTASFERLARYFKGERRAA